MDKGCEPPAALYCAAIAHFELWLQLGHVRRLTPTSCTPANLNASMTLLASAAVEAAQLADAGFETGPFEAWCDTARQRMQTVAAKRAAAAALTTALPDLVDDAAASLDPATRKYPSGILPDAVTPSTQGMDGLRARAEDNLGSLLVLPAATSTRRLLQLLTGDSAFTKHSDAGQADQLTLCSIEAAVFAALEGMVKAHAAPLQKADVQALMDLVDRYRITSQRYTQKCSLHACMHSERRSR